MVGKQTPFEVGNNRYYLNGEPVTRVIYIERRLAVVPDGTIRYIGAGDTVTRKHF
ncbi:MAG: hypothetical protein LBB41_07530 [Prevotellaceae bacterium]|jgi:hypothetical protein|nr:hypothetical protein [Prevotellaceae bacterium]